MNAADVNRLIEALGWTLLHSLWQGLIVFVVLTALRRMVPAGSAKSTYAIGVAALALIACLALGTFALTVARTFPSGDATSSVGSGAVSLSTKNGFREITPAALFVPASTWIAGHLREFVLAWMVGVVFFAQRLTRAWWHFRRLQNTATWISGAWEARIGDLAVALGLHTIPRLGQSAVVDSPLLLGYIKPVILLPVGMLSGLSPAQVEAILLHELAHVKRHDYLVNFLQSAAEVALFFNPFVWIISAFIRRDREQCCDDIVVAHKNPFTYVQALYTLEASRLNPTLALGAIGTKNQLLHRIKRIMETTEKKENQSGRMFPALFLVLMLIGASWLSIQAYQPDPKNTFAPADTSKTDTLRKIATYRQRTITTYDKQGRPRTETTEKFDGDESLRPLIAPPDVEFDMPPVAGLEALSELEQLKEMAPLAELNIDSLPMNFRYSLMDTIPGVLKMDGDNFNAPRRRLGDIDIDTKMAMDQMMAELNKQLAQVQVKINQYQQVEVQQQMEREMSRLNEEVRRMIPLQEQATAEALRNAERARMFSDSRLDLANESHARMFRSIDRIVDFEEKLSNELVKDGYLSKGEKIKTMEWSDSKSIIVNGKKIKDKDLDKYQKLHREYAEGAGRFRRAE